jgi:hypothetical protein
MHLRTWDGQTDPPLISPVGTSTRSLAIIRRFSVVNLRYCVVYVIYAYYEVSSSIALLAAVKTLSEIHRDDRFNPLSNR